MFQLADIALAEGDLQRANSLAGVLEKSGQNKDEINLLRANILAGEGKFDEALKQLDAISKPNAAAAKLRSQIVANSSQNPADLEKQLETDAMNVKLLGRLCNLYRKDDPQKALAFCRRANAIEPTNVSHAVGYGAALVQAKQYDAAVNLLRNILQKVPDNRTAHANLATALFQLDRYAEAKPEFEWLTAKEPTLAGPYYFLAIAHDHLSEYMDAMANYQSFLRLADPAANKLDIEKINLRLPQLQKLIKEGKGKELKVKSEKLKVKGMLTYAISARRIRFVFLALLFAIHCSLFTVLAQPEPEPIPPPVIVVTKIERQKLDALADLKERTKLSLDLMNSHLTAAEKYNTDQDFDTMFRELGGFHGLLDNAMAHIERQNAQNIKVLDNYKRIEIGLRGFSTRLEGIRRDMPDRYEDYVRKLLIHLRDMRTKAAEPFFKDAIVPNTPPVKPE
ncbi:MAG: tetratricopeptide repeat protein [Chloracidobacterium sp.]|nr:tetratricopeptide repeat protein [Chloracidobacterium sp.]